MSYKVVIDLKNPNALIAMAIVSQNAENPYAVFCEYMKYCICSNTEDEMTLKQIKDAIGNEFGMRLPYNVAAKCIIELERSGFIQNNNHLIKRVGSFDIEEFDRNRAVYQSKEDSVINDLIVFAAKYGRSWTSEYAREQLVKVLDRKGLAYDIFLHGNESRENDERPEEFADELNCHLPDDEVCPNENDQDQPLYTDEYFAGKYVTNTISGTGDKRDYLLCVCEGIMLCVGTYQLPTNESEVATPQISGTEFFFDTRLLLRFVGCAGEAAIDAVKELVEMIQKYGGKISYYPQTLEEMQHAFDDAITSLENNSPPLDDEMRLFTTHKKNSIFILRAKKENLEKELSGSNIYLRQHESFTDEERIRFGFDQADLRQFMSRQLYWEPKTIENDACSLWETHMRRGGNYSQYFGTRDRLPVFVTQNSRLVGIAMGYRETRGNTYGISGWKHNRLPVITDIKLTCRLWSPASQSERLSLLYLTANAVAAQRPTKRYLDAVRDFAVELGKDVPAYSDIPLPSFFEDNISEAFLEKTGGLEENFNIGSFASTIDELAEWREKEQEEKTKSAIAERDEAKTDLCRQTSTIINGAVSASQRKFRFLKAIMWMLIHWPAIISVMFAGIASLVSALTGNWCIMFVALIPSVIKGLELFFSSLYVERKILQWTKPRIENSFERQVEKNLRGAEIPLKCSIIQGVKDNIKLWGEFIKMADK